MQDIFAAGGKAPPSTKLSCCTASPAAFSLAWLQWLTRLQWRAAPTPLPVQLAEQGQRHRHKPALQPCHSRVKPLQRFHWLEVQLDWGAGVIRSRGVHQAGGLGRGGSQHRVVLCCSSPHWQLAR